MTKLIQVTTWSQRERDFTAGRWVQLGPATRLNFWLTGLPGGKIVSKQSFPWIRYEPCRVRFDQHTTAWLPQHRVSIPRGLGPDGWVKALFGQRRIVNTGD